MKFVKIGEVILNLDAVASAQRFGDREVVVRIIGTYPEGKHESVRFVGKDSVALWNALELAINGGS
jgi:hypothetical protein